MRNFEATHKISEKRSPDKVVYLYDANHHAVLKLSGEHYTNMGPEFSAMATGKSTNRSMYLFTAINLIVPNE